MNKTSLSAALALLTVPLILIAAPRGGDELFVAPSALPSHAPTSQALITLSPKSINIPVSTCRVVASPSVSGGQNVYWRSCLVDLPDDAKITRMVVFPDSSVAGVSTGPYTDSTVYLLEHELGEEIENKVATINIVPQADDPKSLACAAQKNNLNAFSVVIVDNFTPISSPTSSQAAMIATILKNQRSLVRMIAVQYE
jgi:hypothetical protein